MGDGQTATIPLAEYRSLMEDRAELARVRGLTGGGVLCVSPRARFRGDAEVVAFLNEHATTATIEWLRDEARRRFGGARAPSRSAIGAPGMARSAVTGAARTAVVAVRATWGWKSPAGPGDGNR
jgi:hypothetical protein